MIKKVFGLMVMAFVLLGGVAYAQTERWIAADPEPHVITVVVEVYAHAGDYTATYVNPYKEASDDGELYALIQQIDGWQEDQYTIRAQYCNERQCSDFSTPFLFDWHIPFAPGGFRLLKLNR